MSDRIDRDRVAIVQEIYEASVSDDALRRLAPMVAQATRSSNSCIFLKGSAGFENLSATISDRAIDEYRTYYGAIDPYTVHALRYPLGTLSRSDDHVSASDFEKTEFYVDYARHLDMFRPAGTIIAFGPGRLLAVGVNRSQHAAPYDAEDSRWITELTRHVEHALRLRFRIASERAAAAAGYQVLDRVTFGVAVLDPAARVVFLNRAAEALAAAGDAVLLAQGRLVARRAGEGRRLDALVREAAQGRSGGGLRLAGTGEAPPLLGLVTPLPGSLGPGDGPPLTLVALRRERDPARPPGRLLADLFGLSPAEADVAWAVAGGLVPEEIARRRGVKIATLRTQLESIFRKTGSQDQRDLVRLIGALPALDAAPP